MVYIVYRHMDRGPKPSTDLITSHLIQAPLFIPATGGMP